MAASPAQRREWVRRLAAGQELEPPEAHAFAAHLRAAEAAGHRFLGQLDTGDPPTDTVSGRCGEPPRPL